MPLRASSVFACALSHGSPMRCRVCYVFSRQSCTSVTAIALHLQLWENLIASQWVLLYRNTEQFRGCRLQRLILALSEVPGLNPNSYPEGSKYLMVIY